MNTQTSKKRLLAFWKANKTVTDKNVMKAFLKVPRHKFLDKKYHYEAYADYPLPTRADQTISQPSTVMRMTEELQVMPGMNVLEVGTGSGYQAALLSVLVGKNGRVTSVEIQKELVAYASKILATYKNVSVFLIRANTIGYKTNALYDRIIVTAAMPRLPDQLIDQLKVNGILVAPVGKVNVQELLVVTKVSTKKLQIKKLGLYQFVPLHGKYGF